MAISGIRGAYSSLERAAFTKAASARRKLPEVIESLTEASGKPKVLITLQTGGAKVRTTLSAGLVRAYFPRQRQSSNASQQRAAASNRKTGASSKRRGTGQSCTRGGGPINAGYRTFVCVRAVRPCVYLCTDQ